MLLIKYLNDYYLQEDQMISPEELESKIEKLTKVMTIFLKTLLKYYCK